LSKLQRVVFDAVVDNEFPLKREDLQARQPDKLAIGKIDPLHTL
jgi:hypothetical protein